MKAVSISKVAIWAGRWKERGKTLEGHPGTSCTWVALVEWTQGESQQPLVCFTCWVLSIIASASAISFWFIPQRLATFVWHRWWTFIPHAERKNAAGEEQEKKPWGLYSDMFLREHYNLISRQESLWLALHLRWTVDRSPKLTLVRLNHLWMGLLTRKY